MSDEMDTRLHEYAERWRAAQPAAAPLEAPRTRPLRWQPLVAAAAGLALIAGVVAMANQTGDSRPDSVLPAGEQLATTPCFGEPLERDLRRLPDGFEPVQGVICTSEHRTFEGEGRWLFQQEWRAHGDKLDELADRLRRPDGARPEGVPAGSNICLGYADGQPDLALVDNDGHAVWVKFPRDACGHVELPTRRLFEQLPLEYVGGQRLRLIESAEAVATGCGDRSKDVIADGDPNRANFKPRPVDSETPGIDRVCIYRNDPKNRYEANREAGKKFTTEESNALRSRFDGLPPAEPCSTPHTRYAVVETGTVYLYVELDGCHRIMTGGWGWSQGSRQLAADVEAAVR